MAETNRHAGGGHPTPVRTALGVLGLIVGLAAVAIATLVAVAPVESSTSRLTWPRAGQEPEPTTAFLVPYRPASLEATVPCRSVREAQDRRGRMTVLATTTSGSTRGLVVRTEDGAMQVLLNGRAVDVGLPGGDCTVQIRADDGGVTISGASPPISLPGDPVPEVFAVTTDLTGASADGLAFTARTPSWFDNSPTTTKNALVTLQLPLAAVALGLLVLLGMKGARPPTSRTGAASPLGRVAAGWAQASRTLRTVLSRRARALRDPGWAGGAGGLGRAAVDVAVAGGLVWWSVVGPMTDDDGFASVIAQQADDGGPVGNYYRWFNAAEAPFSSSQRVLTWFLDAGLDPVTLRIPSVLAGFALWLVVSRGVLGPALGGVTGTAPGAGRSVALRALAALALAVWWLPYNLGTRPEPLVALGVTTVLALVLRAVRSDPPTTHPVPLLGLAVLTAGATLTVGPSGVLAAAPFLLCAPRVWQALVGGAGRRPGLLLAARIALLTGLGAVAVTIVFAEQSWHGVVVATAIHDQIGPSHPWYAEWLRYGYLFGDDSWGSATKRLPVLLSLVTSVPALVLLARPPVTVAGREPAVLLGLVPVGLVMLAATPSKWSHHFGALAGFGAVFLTAVVVSLIRVAVAGRDDTVLRVTGAATTVGIVLAAAFAFSGPNAWWGYANAGVPAATGPVRPFDNPLLWLIATAAVLAAVSWPVLVSRARSGETTCARTRTAALVPAVLAVLVAATSTGVLTTSFALSADRGDGRWSFAAQNRAAAAGPASPGACGLQDRVQVLTTVEGGPLTPTAGSTATLEGFVADGGYADPPPRRPDQTDGTRDGRYVWGSYERGNATVGELTTPWFDLDRPGKEQELAASVAGRTDNGATVIWEFAQGDAVVGQRRVVEAAEPERGYRGYAADAEQERLQDQGRDRSEWRTVTVRPADIPAGADRVRLRATDDRTDNGGWVAVTGPRIVDITPLTDYLVPRGPVLLDWSIVFAWPCRPELPPVVRGVATAPGAIIAAPLNTDDPRPGLRTPRRTTPDDIVPERWTLDTLRLTTGTDTAGSFAGLTEAATLLEVDTRLAGEPARTWGRLLVPDYGDLAKDRYGLDTVTTRIPGTEGDPPPVREPQPAG